MKFPSFFSGRPIFLAGLAGLLLSGTVLAQDTNDQKTILETFDAQTGVTIVKGTLLVGSVPTQTGWVRVSCKEYRDAITGRTASGLAIDMRENEALADTTFLDYDELDSFLKAIDYIATADSRVTPLPVFDVEYTARDGLKIASYSSNRSLGTIHIAFQSNHFNKVRILLTPQQLAQFKAFVEQAKAKLDSLRAVK